MKRLFSKISKNSAGSAKSSAPEPPITGTTLTAKTGLQPSYIVPPVPHPSPHEHIALLASEAGLLIRPHVGTGLPHPASHVRLSWSKALDIAELPNGDPHVDWKESVIVYGIVGLMTLFNASYLLVITSRSDVGQLFDASHSIYGVKRIVSIPLVKDRARAVLLRMASRNATAHRPSLVVRDDDDLEVDSEMASGGPQVTFADEDDVKIMTPLAEQMNFPDNSDDRPVSPELSSGASTPASDDAMANSPIMTIASRMSFWGRLSKHESNLSEEVVRDIEHSLLDEPESLSSVVHDIQGEAGDVINSIIAATAPTPASSEERHTELEKRILREFIKEFTKGDMYFSLNFDITRSMQHKHEEYAKLHTQNKLLAQLDVLFEPSVMLPLWRRVDRRFWWNEWLSKPLIDAGLHSYVTPVMQGYIQISSFDLYEDVNSAAQGHSVGPVDYIIFSRRSRDRAGLRYQRRGVDDEAHVANFVETEVITRVERDGISNVFSYVQIRGSIPLFWTQSGYSMKPPPVLAPERTPEETLDALKLHFRHTVDVYGPHTIVNLTEQQGGEAILTNAYRDYAAKLDPGDAQYCEFDFHHETRGMKYENISKLVNQLEHVFQSQGFFWISNNTILSKQKGVFRVNCIDCLDRTNVVQSAFARHVMSKQLEAIGLLNPQKGKTRMDSIFNDVWANNGDAISRAYAGTSALKGDFTRTGKRDLGGLLNDGVNSLTRMYSATFSDWFRQAVIDFMLGCRTLSVFEEFLVKLQSTDPGELIRLSKIRTEAIATCVDRVLSEGETLISGWTVFSPERLNVKIDDRFEEKVLLLSAHALYIISYDYRLEKVKLYTSIPLSAIVRLEKGAYVISPLEEASRNPVQNAGFSVHWRSSDQISMRMASYSISNRPEDAPVSTPPALPASSSSKLKLTLMRREPTKATTPSKTMAKVSENATGVSDACFAAFKVLPVEPPRVRSESRTRYAEPADDLAEATTCSQVVDLMVDIIGRACNDAGNSPVVIDRDIVSLAEAQKMTSIYAKMEHGMKRLLWLGALV